MCEIMCALKKRVQSFFLFHYKIYYTIIIIGLELIFQLMALANKY